MRQAEAFIKTKKTVFLQSISGGFRLIEANSWNLRTFVEELEEVFVGSQKEVPADAQKGILINVQKAAKETLFRRVSKL